MSQIFTVLQRTDTSHTYLMLILYSIIFSFVYCFVAEKLIYFCELYIECHWGCGVTVCVQHFCCKTGHVDQGRGQCLHGDIDVEKYKFILNANKKPYGRLYCLSWYLCSLTAVPEARAPSPFHPQLASSHGQEHGLMY